MASKLKLELKNPKQKGKPAKGSLYATGKDGRIYICPVDKKEEAMEEGYSFKEAKTRSANPDRTLANFRAILPTMPGNIKKDLIIEMLPGISMELKLELVDQIKETMRADAIAKKETLKRQLAMLESLVVD